ncbi:hypothetical protein [Thermogutta sp.]|uniref:hypothetical protein n=1 Tax=Thermogutta sp. TaxID=1962930 RepID=UPI00321FBF75
MTMGVYTRTEVLFWLIPAGLLLFREVRRGHSVQRFVPYIIALALMISPLFLRNAFLYGDPLARLALTRRDPVSLSQGILSEPPLFMRALFVSLGQGFIFAPDWIYIPIAILFLAGWGDCSERFAEICPLSPGRCFSIRLFF